jgi:hypothetical protein
MAFAKDIYSESLLRTTSKTQINENRYTEEDITMKRNLLLTSLTILLLSVTAVAEVPQSISYQGYLAMPNGNPVQDDDYTITFSIYPTADDPTAIWSSGPRLVEVIGGAFQYYLGSNVVLSPDLFTADTTRWLGIQVDPDDEMVPRTHLVSVPYAYKALDSDTAGFAFTLDLGTITTPHMIDGAVTSAKILDGTLTFSDIGQNGATTGQVMKWNGSAWAAADDESGGGNWTLIDDVLFTNGEYGIARAGNTLYGIHDSTHVNLGVICTTGTSGEDFKYSTVSGGYNNTASGFAASVGGGVYNIADSSYSTVGGGHSNTASANYSSVGGGKNNIASGYHTSVGGGGSNIASSNLASVGGGWGNTANDTAATVGGGIYNSVSGKYSAILGGYADTITATGDYSYLFGIGSKLTQDSTFMVDMPHIRIGDEATGYELPAADGTADQVMATDGAGQLSWTTVSGNGNWTLTGDVLFTNGAYGVARAGNTLYGIHDSTHVNLGLGSVTGTSGEDFGFATVGGGQFNTASGDHATVGGGGINNASGSVASVGGGAYNTASGENATVGGGWSNIASGWNSSVIGGSNNTADSSYASVGGGATNKAGGNFATVGGGQNNTADSSSSTVGGGSGNSASAYGAFVGGGYHNTATANMASVGGGSSNNASASGSSVGGGSLNEAQGNYSAILGGYADTITATGDYSYLFGIGSKLTADSTFMVDMPHVRIGDEATGYEFPTSDGTADQVMSTDGAGQLSWSTVSGGGNWTLTGDVLYTAGQYGIARAGNTLHGIHDSTHINLGGNSTTGTPGQGNMYATVSGGFGNSANSDYSSVGGGSNNRAGGWYATVGGGNADTADGYVATVGGGKGNTASGNYATVSGGWNNTADSSFASVGGGVSNIANAKYATVSGGWNNTADSIFSTVGGGNNNTANANHATVGGGEYNNASNSCATVSGGSNNEALAYYTSISGGISNLALNWYASVGGGQSNLVSGYGASVGGGSYNRARGIYSVVSGGGGIDYADSNAAGGDYSAILGGSSNTASGWSATICGGTGNTANDTAAAVGGGSYNRARGIYSVVAGGGGGNDADSNMAGGDYSAIGGGSRNTASGLYSTIGGGATALSNGAYATVGGGLEDTATGYAATVSGGQINAAIGAFTTVGGGRGNRATGIRSTISGGVANMAIGEYAAIGGGKNDSASGNCSTVPGGYANKASGSYSFAAGRRAKALHHGSFVWGDQYNGDFSSTTTDQFSIRASGGTRIYSNGTLTAGVSLPAGGSAWSPVSDSTLKRNIREVDYQDVLNKVAELPISRWSYKAQDESIEHIGPMAQDFYRLFGLGEDDKRISTLDPDGVALAAIKAVYDTQKRLQAKVEKIDLLEAKLDEMEGIKKELASLKEMVVLFMAQSDKTASDKKLAAIENGGGLK